MEQYCARWHAPLTAGKEHAGHRQWWVFGSLQINTWVSKSHLLTEKLYSLLSYFVTGILLCYLLSQVFHPSFLSQCCWHSVSLEMQAPGKKMFLKVTLWYTLDDTRSLLPCTSADSECRGTCMAFHQMGLHLALRLPALSCFLKSHLGVSGAFEL